MDNQVILTGLMNDLKTDVINSMQSKGRYATGETVAALETVATNTTGQLLAPAYIDALEVGRKPTSQGAPAGNPTLFERIVDWIQAKGLTMNPYAVTKSIHKKGYPGKPGVLTEPLSEDNINMRTNAAIDEISAGHQQEVMEIFNVFD